MGRRFEGLAGVGGVDGRADEGEELRRRKEVFLFIIFVGEIEVVGRDTGLEQERVFLTGLCDVPIVGEEVGEAVSGIGHTDYGVALLGDLFCLVLSLNVRNVEQFDGLGDAAGQIYVTVGLVLEISALFLAGGAHTAEAQTLSARIVFSVFQKRLGGKGEGGNCGK